MMFDVQAKQHHMGTTNVANVAINNNKAPHQQSRRPPNNTLTKSIQSSHRDYDRAQEAFARTSMKNTSSLLAPQLFNRQLSTEEAELVNPNMEYGPIISEPKKIQQVEQRCNSNKS